MSNTSALFAAMGKRSSVLLLIFLCGCGLTNSEPVRFMRDITKTANSLADSLQGVHDAASAQTAAADIEEQSTRLIDLLSRYPQMAEKHKTTRVRKDLAEQLIRDMMQAMQRVTSEAQRIDKMRGLPAEFWRVVAGKFIEIGVLSIEIARTQGVSPVSNEAVTYMYQVRDMIAQHGYENVVLIRMADFPERLAGQAHDKLLAAAQGAAIFHLCGNGEFAAILAPVADYRAFAAKLDIGAIVTRDEPRRLLEIQADRRKLGDRELDLQEKLLAEAQKKHLLDERRREKAEPSLPDAESLAKKFGREGLDPKDPNYHEKLAERMQSDNYFQRKEAIDALLRIDPDEVKSAETRKKIARAFKEAALDKHGSDRGKAVRGLARWGGKFSVPFLLEILDERHSFVAEEVFQALGALQDERAAVPVASRLGDFFVHDMAVKCLKRMGPAAEDAVLAIVASPDPKICLAAVEILGEIGTKKCLPTLRTALAQSRNPQVKFAAKTALKNIANRQKADSSEKK